MASRKQASPSRSRKALRSLTAFAQARKGTGDGEETDETDEAGPADEARAPVGGKAAEAPVEKAAASGAAERVADKPVDKVADKPVDKVADKPVDKVADKPAGAAAENAPPRAAEPVRPAEPAPAAKGEPASTAAAAAPTAAVSDDDATDMPDPDKVVPGDPEASAPPPRGVPSGDARSLRRGEGPTQEFALVYRRKGFLVTRVGIVGQRGRWRVVEYPSQGAAAHAYAQECSRLLGDGYADYRG